jgi:hypothetical protein
MFYIWVGLIIGIGVVGNILIIRTKGERAAWLIATAAFVILIAVTALIL